MLTFFQRALLGVSLVAGGVCVVATFSACERIGPPPCPAYAFPLPRAADASKTMVKPHLVARFFPAPPPPAAQGVLEAFHRDWFAAKLFDFGEGPLSERPTGLHAYRILFLPSRNATGDSVLRIEHGQDTVAELKRTTPCAEGRFEGAAVAVSRASVSDKAWHELLACMDAFFWTAQAEPSDLRSLGTDGWTTMIEGFRDGKYHAVHRWCLQCPDSRLSAPDAGLAECVRLAHTNVR
jgi:hypothetical protein